jgi:hypothetical protein
MKEYLIKTERAPVFYFLLATFLLVLPFLIISVYNHPSADDYSYSHFGNRFGFWAAQVEHYFTWSGRYTATALLTVNPIDYTNLSFYRILPVLHLISFVFAVYIFLRSALPKAKLNDQLLMSFLIIFLYIYYTPNLSEAFYWMPGSVTYQLASTLSLLLFSLIFPLLRGTSKEKEIIYLIAGSILTFTTIGLNETSMLILCVTFSALFTMQIFRTRSLDHRLLLFLVITIAASSIVIAAPGNLVRMAEKPEKFQLLPSILGSFKTTLLYIGSWIPMTFLTFALFSPLLYRLAQNMREQFKLQWLSKLNLAIIAFLFLGFLALCFFPSYWSQGGKPPARTVNVIYLLFILGAMALVVLFFAYLQIANRPLPKIPLAGNVFLVLAATAIIGFKPNNVRNVYKDLFSGTAYRYHKEMNKRYSLLENCNTECNLPPIENRPSTLFAYDLAKKPSEELNYYNRDLGYYFGLTEVKVRPKKRK